MPADPCPLHIEEPVRIPLSDGTRLAAKLWRPADAGPVPAVLEYLPYRFRDGTRARDQAMHGWIAGQGYACLRVDIRGMGESEGLLHDEYSPQEQADALEVIQWIAAQGWCDGQVAMMGISWSGFNALQVAALQPPALKTVIAVGFTDDRFATDVHYVGGLISKDNFDWSATMLAQNDLPPDPATFGPLWREEWLKRARANTPWAHHWFAHQRRDAYWRQGSVCEDYAAIRVPVYAISGWADNYSEAVPRLLAGLTVPARGLIGPWAHSWPHDVTVGPAIGGLQEVVRWLDHWLKGQDRGIMAEPFLRAWIQDPAPPLTCYADRPGRWVGEDHWPSPRIKDLVLDLSDYGQLGAGGLTRALPVRSPLWVGLTAGEVGRYGDEADWPPDQRLDDGGSLVFLGAPLAAGMDLFGAPKVRLSLSADKPVAQICARLTVTAPDGARTRIGVGLLNLTHRDGHAEPQALVPGQVYDITVEMDDIGQHVAAGERIGLALSSGYYPIAHPPPELATLTIHGGTLHLPDRPPRPEDAALRVFDPPVTGTPTPQTSQSVPSVPRRVTMDLLTGRYVVDFPRWTYSVTMEDTATTVTSTGHVRHEITEGDPLSALTTTEYHVVIERHGIRAEHRSNGRLTCTASHFRLQTELTVRENGQTIHAARWDESFPRDHQ